jgi:hypothetical protein
MQSATGEPSRHGAHRAPVAKPPIESRIRLNEYTPTAFIDAISPGLLLMFAMSDDRMIPLQRQQEVFALAASRNALRSLKAARPQKTTDLPDTPAVSARVPPSSLAQSAIASSSRIRPIGPLNTVTRVGRHASHLFEALYHTAHHFDSRRFQNCCFFG